MLNAALAITLIGPAGAAIASLVLRSHPPAALRVAIAGAAVAGLGSVACLVALALDTAPTVGDSRSPWLRFDSAAAVLGLVVVAVALTVLLFARHQLADDVRAGRFAAAASGLLAATLLLATGARLSVVVVAWLVASVCTVALCGYRGDGASRTAARTAAAAFLVGDAALVGALGATSFAIGGDLDLSRVPAATEAMLDRSLSLGGLGSVSAASVVAALVVVAALARAAQVPFRPWLTSTVAAPTPVSALLHAGSVNAGGFLLVRLNPVLAAAPTVALVLAGCTITTIAWAAAAIRARSDVKGRLATSTAAQMAFMLLACAAGAPVAALTHLGGHALYKSARFLGAGGAVAATVAERRDGHTPDHPAAGALGALILGSVGLATWVAISAAADIAAAERWVVGAVVVALMAHTGWSAASLRGPRARATLVTGISGMAMVTAAALVAHGLVDVVHPTGGPAPWVVAAAVICLGAVEVVLRRSPARRTIVAHAAARTSAPTRARPRGHDASLTWATGPKVQEAW